MPIRHIHFLSFPTLSLGMLLVTTLLTACGVKEEALHERLAPVERQTEELQADQQELLQRLAASEAEMQRLSIELDMLRPQPKGKKGKSATPKLSSPAGMDVPPPKVITQTQAAAEDRRLQSSPATPSVPAVDTASVPPSTVAPASPSHAPVPAGATPGTAPGAIPSGTLAVTSPAAQTIPAIAQPASPNSEQGAYKLALSTYEKGRFSEAEQLFDRYLQTWPSGKFAPNAVYWKGECLYSKGRTADAVFLFKDVLTRFPKHQKAPDALLKSIMAYKRLGDADNARLHFSVLQEDYPKSPALKRAKELRLDR